MDFLDFEAHDGGGEPPKRVCERLDSIEPEIITSETRRWTYFESVDADRFGRAYDKSLTPSDQILKTPVSVPGSLMSGGTAQPHGMPDEEGRWAEQYLSDDPAPHPLDRHLDPLAAIMSRHLSEACPLSPVVTLCCVVSPMCNADERRDDGIR